MKRIYLTITLIALLFTIHITPTIAQDMGLIEESTYNGKGVALEDITFTGTTSERILFYNIGRKRFLNAGGFWGTRTATHTVGLPLIIEKVENQAYCYIQSPLKNEEKIYMAKVTEDQDEKNVRNGVFLDREKTVSARIAPRWRITRVEYKDIDNPQEYGINEDDIVYKIECRTDDNYASNNNLKNNLELVGNCKMTISVFEEGNYNLVRGLPTTHANYDKKYSYWKIVNLKEFNETTTNAKNYYNEQPIDLTFLIRGQNFNRLNKYNLVPQEESLTTRGWSTNYKDVGGSSTTDDWYKTDFRSAGVYYFPNGGSQDNHGDGKFGMFYCGRITGVKITNDTKPNYTIYQNIPITQPGWYRIDCQGFYKTNGTDCLARIFAISDETAASGTAKNAYVNLLPQHYLKYYDENISVSKDAYNYDTNYILADLKAHNAPDNYVEAGVAFYTGCYPNSVLVYVSKENTNIKTGIEVLKRSMTDDEAIYFDDFRLKYLGQSFSLDERNTLTSPLTDKTNNKIEYIKRPMVLRRTLNKGKWNPIVLPVDLTKAQVNTTFFPLPLIAEFKGFKDANTLLFKIIDLTDPDKFPDENTVAMEAGHCYLINSGYEGHSGSIMIGDADGKTMRGPYYVIDRVTYTKKPEINIDVETPRWSGTDCELSIVGTYEPAFVPKWSFLMDNSTLWHINDTYMARGYSWWIEDKHQKEDSAQAHLFTLSAMDSGYDEVTGLYEVKINNGSLSHHNDKVYNLQGIEVNGNAALPKGIYISNGKKFIVK